MRPSSTASDTGAGSNDAEQWTSGIKKLMKKVRELDTTNHAYAAHPAKFKAPKTTTNATAPSAYIHKGQMVFGRSKKDVNFEARPDLDSFMIEPFSKQLSKHRPFAFYPDHGKSSKLELSPSTSAHLLEAANQVNMQGETSHHFEYLVNKDFLQPENKDLDKQASRLNKLSALCKKTTNDTYQLRREVRAGNYDIDQEFAQHVRPQTGKLNYDPTDAYFLAQSNSP